MITRRQALAAAATVLAAPPRIASAQTAWPAHTIRFIVPFAAGGSNDVIARVLGQHLSRVLGQTIIVENRPGAGGSTAADFVAKANPDGYTWLMCNSATHALNLALYPNLPYDPIKDFTHAGTVAIVPNVLVVNPKLPVHTTAELIAYGKANPGKLNYSSGGIGSAGHIATAYLASMAGLDMLHVPYRGGGPSLAALVGGEIHLTITGALGAMPLVRNGQLRGLAVTSTERVPFAPDLPTVAETVPGYDAVQWNGIVMPARTPDEIVRHVNVELNKVLSDPEVSGRLAADGGLVLRKTPEEFRAYIQAEIDRWIPVIKNAGITPG